MRLAFVCLALCGSVKAQSMTGFWTGTFTENSINKTLQVYFDSNGIYESRMEKSDSTGMILS